MDRFSLTDAQWEKMQPFCLGKPTDPGRTGGDARLFVEAVLWIARTGSPWRRQLKVPSAQPMECCRRCDLPTSFGNWNTVFKRFRDWVKADVFKRMFEAVSDEPDIEYAMVDATIVRVHRHGQGAKGALKARPLASRRAE
jgi:transposase